MKWPSGPCRPGHSTRINLDAEVGFIGGMDFAGGRGHITTSAAWSSSSRRISKADVMSYRDKRALQGLGRILKLGFTYAF